MKVLKIAAFSAAVLAGGCASEMAWQRDDGGPLDRRVRLGGSRMPRARPSTSGGSGPEAMKRCM